MKILKILVIFLLLSTVYPIPIVIPDSPSDVWALSSIYSMVRQIDSDTYTMRVYAYPINYNDSGVLKPINTSFELLPTDHVAYQYGYRAYNDKGVFSVFLKPNIQSDWTVAFAYNRSNNPTRYVLRHELVGIGYIDPSQDFAHHILQTPLSSVGSIDKDTVTYSNAFSGCDIRWTYDNEKLKEEIELSNTSKTLLQNHPPSDFGLSNKDSFFAIVTKLDFGLLNITDGVVDYSGDFSFNKSRLYFKNAEGKILFTLPVGFVFEKFNVSNAKNLVFRFKKIGGYYYLFSGIKVTTLNQMQFPVVFDPTSTFYSSTNDGTVYYSNLNWDTCHDATSGNLDTTSTRLNNGIAASYALVYEIHRSFFYFDTSSIPDTATVDSATLYLYGFYYAESSVCAMKGTQGSTLSSGDYDSFTGSEYGHTSWSISTYNSISFNSQGCSDIDKTGTTKICCREYNHDYLDSAPNGNYRCGVYYADYTGTSRDPYLEVTYSTADTTPPSPDPMTWDTEPYETSSSAISMVATTASDSSPPIYYYFDEVTGNTGGTDSGWQTSTTYSDTGLSENTRYGYRVKAKDSASTPNEGSYSSISYEYTAVDPPTDAEFTIDSYGTSWINMSVSVPPNYNTGSTGCYFDGVTGTPPDSGWITGGTNYTGSRWYYNCTGLSPGTTYGFRVKYRNGDATETTYTSEKTQTTTSITPTITINFAGNLSDSGGPYWQPPGESQNLSNHNIVEWREGYYTNDSRQIENWIYINCTITNATTVYLNWLNETTWTNDTYALTNTGGDYWEINTSGNISVSSGYNYSFDIKAYNNAVSNISKWEKVGIDGGLFRRFVQLGCTTENISYNPYYYHSTYYSTATTWKKDRLRHDQGPDGSEYDTGIINSTIPSETIEERDCSSYVAFWFDETVCIPSWKLKNIYFHVWWSSDNGNLENIGYDKTRECPLETFDASISDINASECQSHIYWDSGKTHYNDTFNLYAGLLNVPSYLPSSNYVDNDIYEFVSIIDSNGHFPMVISNRSVISFLIFNIPSNSTLSSMDSDNDGLNDYQELFSTYTSPFLSDTDNDGVSDYDEYQQGTDPNNYTDYQLEYIWIDITNDTWALGNVVMGSSVYTNETGETFIADMDNTTVNTDLKLQITSDATDWSAATSGNGPGTDIYRLNASVDTWSTENQIVTASATTISTNIPAGQNETFDLRFDAPTSTSTGEQQSITVTATLVKH